MTHFNHDWTNDEVAIPQSVGDRYYAQDLNDDFNYLKHLPYEAILQGRTKGVMIPSTDTWDADTHSLSLSGGFGVVALNTSVLDVDEDFTIPPKTILVTRFERIPFANTILILPNDGDTHYIVATPTKRSLLQRGKALLSEQYGCRVKYDGIITIQDTAPTTDQILVGLCHDNEYLLCKDFVFNQCVDAIKLHKWYGKNKITWSLVALLQTYYNTTTEMIETKVDIYNTSGGNTSSIKDSKFINSIINVNEVIGHSLIQGGTYTNCIINANLINGMCIIEIGSNVIFNKCTINVNENRDVVIGSNVTGVFNNCNINVSTNTVGGNPRVIDTNELIFNNCNINCGDITNSGSGIGINGGTFNNCSITIGAIANSASAKGINDGSFNNCTIKIDGIYGGTSRGIYGGTFNNCSITIVSVSNGGTSIYNNAVVSMYFVHALLPTVPSLSSVTGKAFVANTTTIKPL